MIEDDKIIKLAESISEYIARASFETEASIFNLSDDVAKYDFLYYHTDIYYKILKNKKLTKSTNRFEIASIISKVLLII